MAKKKSNVVTVNFEGVEAGGAIKIEDGKYELEVVKASQETSDNSGEDYIAWEFKVVGPKKSAGKKLFHNNSLQKQSLWSLRGLLEVLGVEVPDDEMELDLDDLEGRTCGGEVLNEPYKGKDRPRLVDFFEVGEEEEDEKPSKKKKDEDEDSDDEEDDEPKKKKGKKSDEEDEKPAKKGKKSKKTYTADGVMELDEDGLQELIDKEELEVDLSEYNQLRRKRAAVVEALEEADKLDEEA